MNNNVMNDSLGYQAPQVSKIIFSTEGILCSSNTLGETVDLSTYDLGDIWY